MLELSLQIWGGTFYLLNKIMFSRAERCESETLRSVWRVRSWSVYLAGLPAWVLLFVSEHNWIVASVETSGAPAMVAGLLYARQNHGKDIKALDRFAKSFVLAGLVLSFYEFGGFSTISQFFELGIAAGFLLGTYFIARDNANGYFWLMIGNVSCASLMCLEGFLVLMVQQLVSLIFVTDAYLSIRQGRDTAQKINDPEKIWKQGGASRT